MDLPNELLHMILEFLPNNEHWSKFRQSSVRIYSLPTRREERARYIGKIRELKKYKVMVKHVCRAGYMCRVCFQIFNMIDGYASYANWCANCLTRICKKCSLRCRGGSADCMNFCRICVDAYPNIRCTYCDAY